MRSCLPTMFRRGLLLACLAGAFAPAWAQGAAGAPASITGPIKLLVGYSAGGPVDAAARQFAPVFSRELGVPVVVENRPGANATLAGDVVSKSEPDGRTLWFAASPPVTISPNIMKKMAFDPTKDLLPIAPLVSYYNVLVVNANLPAKDLKELIALGKASPGKLTYGSAGVGGSNHLSGELFAVKAGLQLTHVPYKGNAPAMTDLIGGQISMMFDIISTARGHISGGRVRAVAVTSPQRNPSLPNVPTMSEAGVPGFDVGGWFALYGPPKLPAAMAARLHEATMKALASTELKLAYSDQGFEIWTAPAQDVATRAAKERDMWGTVTKGIQID